MSISRPSSSQGNEKNRLRIVDEAIAFFKRFLKDHATLLQQLQRLQTMRGTLSDQAQHATISCLRGPPRTPWSTTEAGDDGVLRLVADGPAHHLQALDLLQEGGIIF